jgi:hypothetical protein
VGVDVEFLEFEPEAPEPVLAVMGELAATGDASGWLTLDPAIDERFPPPSENLLGKMVSGRGPRRSTASAIRVSSDSMSFVFCGIEVTPDRVKWRLKAGRRQN